MGHAGPEHSSSCLHSNAPATSSDPNVSDTPQSVRPGPAGVEQPDATLSYEADSIKVEYHPSSGRPTQVFRFEEFNRHRIAEPPPPPPAKPWNPFNTRTDFEFAELTLDAGLSDQHLDALIKMIRRIVQNANDFTFNSHVDVRKTWDAAANKVTPFTKHVITATYKKEPRQYDLYTRDLWDYCKDLLRDPYVVRQMEWDAQRLYRFDGASARWVRFIDEPLTANSSWTTQSKLPTTHKPLLLILYADKTKLSSFGTAKGYPVIVRCGNLPVHIRNGEGPGGGRIVGWLPIVEEEAGEKHKTGFVNFKRIVWHESFRKILEPIRAHSHTGVWYICGDEVHRCVCPHVAILSSDYEEQCVMSLIRGGNGLFPCPMCLVPKLSLGDYQPDYPERTGSEAQAILELAMAQRTVKDREEVLQQWSLRPIQNAFLELGHSDPYKALSFDRLHASHSGLFGHHYWVQFKKHVVEVSNDAVKLIDAQFNAMPRWSGLIHFNEVMGTSFTDGSKYEDISKNLPFVAHNVVTEVTSLAGYQLLVTIRRYLEEDMYVGLPLQTEWTLANGRELQRRHNAQLQKYRELFEDDEDEKNWNFPKMHTRKHAFDDIEQKGVSRNFNTKPNEKMHGPIKKAYRTRTNRRDVAMQLLNIDHHFYIAGHIRTQLDELDAYLKARAEEDAEDSEPLSDSLGGGHISLGARQNKCTIAQFLEAHRDDVAFRNFEQRLSKFLTKEYKAHNIPLPQNKPIKFLLSSMITEYRLLRVNYESMADWRQDTDLIRCSPSFFGMPRYDCIILRSAVGPDFFGRLLCMFTCTVGDKVEPIALILPYNKPTRALPVKDHDLRFYRLHEQTRQRAEFVSLHAVRRGALLVQDFETKDDYLVHDLIDSDMFFRVQALREL
ncbi:hypothetical protein C8Q70DRAFT_917521 [Cubamyces menziesii]|nr:hypothetical protein C8Q70DRAFT_917521 [Cubamyces menziesii]